MGSLPIRPVSDRRDNRVVAGHGVLALPAIETAVGPEPTAFTSGGTMADRTDARPPWKRANPKKTAAKKLTLEQKAEARARARAAGRKYPNLVDNMAVAKAKSARKRKAAKARAAKS